MIEIDAAGSNALRGEEIDEFPAPAPDIEYVTRRFLEVREITPQPFANDLLRTTKLIFEPDVLVGIQRRREGGRGAWGVGRGASFMSTFGVAALRSHVQRPTSHGFDVPLQCDDGLLRDADGRTEFVDRGNPSEVALFARAERLVVLRGRLRELGQRRVQRQRAGGRVAI